jgi:magnesium transporter
VAVDGRLILTDGTANAPDQAEVRKALTSGTLLWLDVSAPSADDLAFLAEALGLHPVTVDDLNQFGQRPKIEDFGNLTYLVSYGLVGSSAHFAEVHILYSEKFLVTVRHQGCHALDTMRDRIGQPGNSVPGGSRPTRLILLHNILDRLIDSFFPALGDLDDRIDALQEQIFARPRTDQLSTLFDMQRWLVSARKIISPQRDMVASLVAGVVPLPGTTSASDPYLRDLYDHLIRINDLIDSYRDLLSNAMSAYLSMVSNNLNEVMKQLTVIATVFLPLSFLTGFFGQNFGWLVARLGSLETFLILGFGTELLAVVGLYVLFRRRGWVGRT